MSTKCNLLNLTFSFEYTITPKVESHAIKMYDLKVFDEKRFVTFGLSTTTIGIIE